MLNKGDRIMPGRSSLMTYRAECIVKYRYTCEQCEYITEWSESKLQQIAHYSKANKRFKYSSEHNIDALEKTKKEALKRLRGLATSLKKNIDNLPSEAIVNENPIIADQYNEAFVLGNACPKCNSRQTWYPAIDPLAPRWKYALNYAIIAVVLGSILMALFGMILFSNFGIDLIHFVVVQMVLAAVGGLVGLIGYGRVSARAKARKQYYDNSRCHHRPEVIWGKPAVELVRAPEIDVNPDLIKSDSAISINSSRKSDTALGADLNITTNAGLSFSEKIINKAGTKKEDLGYWRICGTKHNNILYIHDVVDHQYGVFSVIEEKFESTPLSKLIAKGISETDFQDYILQLCDALEFMHQQEPNLSHNAIVARNILIGKDNVLKLSHFDEVAIGTPTSDIAMVGNLMGRIRDKYIGRSRYQEIINNCAGKYRTVDDFRKDFLLMCRSSVFKAKYASIAFLIVMAIFIIFRRLL